MSTNVREFLELRRADPTSAELRKMAVINVAVGIAHQREGK
ncbi:hypothetical protein LMG28614_05716 [Paraburkholderia ultramafica]|uniref:Uncharacterized protein n=1 Tax=Paraburkholderia ultramafica TaxID=1544867 RepID=A0A6S7BYC9_9BURK|nr:hypothetical protein [Paraburkholderia ultramafica]CAB3802990.1 hypothetical protein LMG28614_05716 [Paraburkholderia ultramafica]